MKQINTPKEASNILMPKPKKIKAGEPSSGVVTSQIESKKLKTAKRREGRPSKREALDYKMVEELAGLGLTDKQMILVIGVAESTFNLWKKDPKFSESLKAGKTKADNQVVKSLYERAKGYSHPEIICFQHRGRIITKEIIKHYPPDPTSLIFWLKNRDKENWRDRVEMDHGVTDETFEKYKQLSVQDLQKKLDELMPNRVAGLLK